MSSRIRLNVPIGFTALTGFLLAVPPAAAQVQTETLTVQARIGQACTVTSASLDFGQDLDLDVNTDANGLIEISCGTPTELSVQLDGGLHFSPSSNLRSMAGEGTSTILYSLFKDSNRQTAWGVGDTVAASIDGDGSVPVYGRVLAQTNGHPPGLYTDEVTITLVF